MAALGYHSTDPGRGARLCFHLKPGSYDTGHGTQYTRRAFAEICRSAWVRHGMGAIGSSADNAAAESFNATFKRETLKGRKGWANEREARLEAFPWLTRYNTRRRHSRLGQRSPIAYENDFQPTATTLAKRHSSLASLQARAPFLLPGRQIAQFS